MARRKADTYVTKDSGQRKLYDSGMVRDTTEGKPRFDLLMPEGMPYDAQMLTRVGRLMERGIRKYGLRNWEKARTPEEAAHFKAAAWRHFIQWHSGEMDEDHAAAVIFNVIGAEYVKWRMSDDSECDHEHIVLTTFGQPTTRTCLEPNCVNPRCQTGECES